LCAIHILILSAVDGCWSQWSEWSCCTPKCNDTVFARVRTRECNNPTPLLGGHFCQGENSQNAVCDDNFTCNGVENGTNSFNATVRIEEEEGKLDCCNGITSVHTGNTTHLNCNSKLNSKNLIETIVYSL